MKLLHLIAQDVDDIVAEWAAFAATRLPAARGLTNADLSDHARSILLAMADDLINSQAVQERHEKSRGALPSDSPALTDASHKHARQRFLQGFSLDQLVSEYRALRASVIRRWTDQHRDSDRGGLDELTRFGETMDQGLTEAIRVYSMRVEESRGLFLGVLGHDLRTPLGAAQMSAQILLRTEGLDGTQAQAVARILRSTERMRGMIEDLLDFTQTSLGVPLPISRAPVDVGKLCREVMNELKAIHPGRTIELQASGPLDGHWDPSRITQMLSNLLANAVQHSEADSRVRVTIAGDSDGVVVEVHNRGVPIPPESQATLFKPLRRLDSCPDDRHAGSSGLGLGLYIAKEIVSAHRGTIEVKSTQADGTTFAVALPARHA